MSTPRLSRGVWLVVAAVLFAVPAAAQTASLELAVKATYLVKFAPFVEWPPEAFAAADSPLVICIVGHEPFGDMVARAIDSQPFSQHRPVLRRLSAVSPDAGCHIAFIGSSPSQSTSAALEALADTPTLTVTNGASSERGIIHFVVLNDRVRFHVDDVEADRKGLRLSSKLLNLALSVRSRT